ncbi:inositol-3-phosphate synthase [Haloarcula nitratireducens]|uniref:Inositol-3-phosphate synthase n=1 Tax=Haloarcula nitratireducens TaxID=2487749 RepID=A0AAW4PE34_9EURY|nr:inositol-3-phosphate synthase [Halomicroarcula nitratireducens]MBX0296129.1 inositol-3-phosphate synthase [Halomicroarcula nitratireducens]
MTETGVWLIGARGNVATTAITGARAMARGETDTTGLVTGRAPYSKLALPDIEGFVFGGHDVRERSLLETARGLSENGVPKPDVVEEVADDLRAIDDRIETGTAINCGTAVDDLADRESLEDRLAVGEVVDQIRDDYESFGRGHDLDRLVVVNVASTEPPLEDPDRYDTREAVERAIENDDRELPASALYAYAALVDGHPYVNFTPSTGSALGGLEELARERAVPHTGRDAKTGETLVKSALAPMFAGRNLRVKAWEGHNILGNGDGKVLEDDRNKAGKIASKGDVLSSLLPDIGHNRVRIDYTPSLDDWKTAWDYIHFEGFLNTEMKMQFTWEGSDSALAAPLVLDLVRLLAHADEHDESGLQPQLASFFKAPLGVEEHNLSRQFAMLDEYVERHTTEVMSE